MQTFEEALRDNLVAQPAQRRRAKKLLELLDGYPSRRRTRTLDRLERHARASTEFRGADWGALDWSSLLKTLIDLLLRILPLLLR